MKILLKLPISPYSGYGNDGIGLTMALIRAGMDVYLDPTGVAGPIPAEVAMLFTKTARAPFDLIINHVDPGALEATEDMRDSGSMVLGWTMWEYSNLLNLPNLKSLKKRIQNFDVMVGYDEVSSTCFEPYFKKPILTVQGGFEPKDWPYMEKDWTEANFYFCMLGQLSGRKDPWVAIEAFQELNEEHPEFKEHARLQLKTTTPGLHSKIEQWIPNIRIIYDVWDAATVKAFYQANHVLLSPSRGEGKNMPALEFQSMGGTVIATNWGGHRQWLHPDYNYALDYTLFPIENFPNTQNAHASKDHLKELMWHAFTHREEVKRKGELASQIIPQMSSWDKVVERLFLHIQEYVPGGDEIFALAQAARHEVENARG